MSSKDCECKKKWIEEVKKKYGTEIVVSSINDIEILGHKKGSHHKSRFRWIEAKGFKFCPHCGKELSK